MKYVQLGRTGLRVSRVCLGMMSFGKHPDREWTLDENEAEPIVAGGHGQLRQVRVAAEEPGDRARAVKTGRKLPGSSQTRRSHRRQDRH